MTRLTGTLVARGRRTVTAAVWHTGPHLESTVSRCPQVLHRARWSPLQGRRPWLSRIRETAGGRRSGRGDRRHARTTLVSHDPHMWAFPRLRALPLRAIRKQPRAALDRDGRGREAALDESLTGRCHVCVSWHPLPKDARRRDTVTRPWACGSLLRRWLPAVPLTLMGDTASRFLQRGLHGAAYHVTLRASCRLDAGSTIRPSRAPRTPSVVRVWVEHVCSRSRRSCRIHRPSGSASRETGLEKAHVSVEICPATALWSRSGSDPVPIRRVRTRDPEGTRPPHARVSPDHRHAAEERVLDVLTHWSVDTTVEEGHAQFGPETHRPWSDLATRRTTPLLCGKAHAPGWAVSSHARCLLSHTGGTLWRCPGRREAGHVPFPTSPTDPDVVFVPRSPRARRAHAVCS
jgi:hypothetical protein